MTVVPPAGPAADAIAVFQAALLRSAIDGAPLPGGAPSIALPDLALAMDGGATHLLDEGVPDALRGALPRGVRLVTRADLARAAAARRSIGYLRLAPPAHDGATVWLALELRLAPPDGGPDLPLGGVQLGLRADGDAWRVAEGPRAYAT